MARSLTTINICKSWRLARLENGDRLGRAAQPAPLLLVHALIGAHHPLSNRSIAANVDSHRAQAEVDRIACLTGADSFQILAKPGANGRFAVVRGFDCQDREL